MDLTFAPGMARAAEPAADRWLRWLGVAMLGYALFSRTFAYIGVPPVFIGEMLLVAGLGLALASGRLGQVLAAPPVITWLLLMAWVIVRTVPYVRAYGLDGVRDAMLVGYGFYMLAVASVLLARPERLVWLVQRYRVFVSVMLALVGLIYFSEKLFGDRVPGLPWAPQVPLLVVKGGDLMVHLTGIAAFLMLGWMRQRPRWVMLLAFTSGVVMLSNRGGMVAFFLGLGLAWAMRPPGTGPGRLVYAFLALLLVGVVVGPLVDVRTNSGSRRVSVEQIVDNVKSIVGSSDSDALDGTKRWRLLWWTDIVDYTVRGPYFFTGKGFGVNLAEADGYEVEDDNALRSPHNGHLTVLARAGVPGFALWLAIQGLWIASLFGAWLRAKLAGQSRWTALFAWLVAFWAASMVNASFDVFLEGPMGGVWVWTVLGVGIAATRIHRSHPTLFDEGSPSLPAPLPHGRDPRFAPTLRASGPPASWSW